MNCPNCFNDVEDGWSSCQHCGYEFAAGSDFTGPEFEQNVMTGELERGYVEDVVPMEAPAPVAPVAPARPAAPQQKKKRAISRLVFHGTGGQIFGMHIVNMFLAMLTLGIYTFWGKVKVRKYLFAQLEFRKQRFSYHGTGKELFIGWLKLMAILAVPIGVNVALTFSKIEGADVISTLLLYLTFACLYPLAAIGSRRYLYSRTSWSGIRFSFRGSVREFMKIYMPGAILTVVTFGLYFPYLHANMHRYFLANTYFGNRAFASDVTGKLTFGSYVLALFLHIPTLGLVWFWFLAKRQRLYAERTTFGKARMRSEVTGRKMFNNQFGNVMLLMFSCGLAYPWVVVRSMRFMADNIVMVGDLDLQSIIQDAQRGDATTADMADMLGLDVGLAV